MLKLILGLLRPDAGRILVHGQRVDDMPERDLLRLRADIGMLFQENALFDSLTVGENVGYRLHEETEMRWRTVCARVAEVLGFIGLASSPTGCRQRCPAASAAASRIARAIAARPSLLLFDDPTTGLDPIIATTVDDEIVKLRDLEQVTSSSSLTRSATPSISRPIKRCAATVRCGSSRRREAKRTRSSWSSTTAVYTSAARPRHCRTPRIPT